MNSTTDPFFDDVAAEDQPWPTTVPAGASPEAPVSNPLDLLAQFTTGALDLARYDLTTVCFTLPELREFVSSTCIEHGFPYDEALGIEGNRVRDYGQVHRSVGLPDYVSTCSLPEAVRDRELAAYAASFPARAGLSNLFSFIEAAREREWELTCDALGHRTKAAEYGHGVARVINARYHNGEPVPYLTSRAAVFAVHAASHARDAIRIEEGYEAVADPRPDAPAEVPQLRIVEQPNGNYAVRDVRTGRVVAYASYERAAQAIVEHLEAGGELDGDFRALIAGIDSDE